MLLQVVRWRGGDGSRAQASGLAVEHGARRGGGFRPRRHRPSPPARRRQVLATPSAGTVVTCSGTTTDQNAPIGYGDASLTGVTINVGTGATVTGTGTGIVAGAGGNTITNQGTVTGNGGTAINFLAGNNNFLTLTPTSVINYDHATGPATGSSSAAPASPTGTFDLSLIGPAAQYRGFSTFNKIGSSPWTLTGVGTQTWDVLVGTLQIDGTIGGANVTSNGRLILNGGTVGGPVAVSNSGVLGGNGTAGTTTLAAISVLAPGASNAIGTIAVNGNLTFGNFTTYQADLTPATSDLVNVNLNANLAGTLMAVAAEGTYVPGQYLLLNALGGINGTFDVFHPIGNFKGLNVALTYDLNNVRLVLSTQPTGQNSQWLANPGTNNWNTAGNWNPRRRRERNGDVRRLDPNLDGPLLPAARRRSGPWCSKPPAPALSFPGSRRLGDRTDPATISSTSPAPASSTIRPTGRHFSSARVSAAPPSISATPAPPPTRSSIPSERAIYGINFDDSSRAVNATIFGQWHFRGVPQFLHGGQRDPDQRQCRWELRILRQQLRRQRDDQPSD